MGAVARSARCPSAPSRPVLRYHGGKFRLASWIVAHLPPSRCRVEAYAGAASVTLAAAPAPIEVINDLDDRIVTVFEVLRDPGLVAAAEDLDPDLHYPIPHARGLRVGTRLPCDVVIPAGTEVDSLNGELVAALPGWWVES